MTESRSPAVMQYHRELFQIAVLIALAVGAFWGARAVHAYAERINVSDAAQWYGRGAAALNAGETGGAVEAFRRAVAKNRGERKYALALASALEGNNEPDAAERVLVALRDSSPEDAEINVALARLNAHNGRVQDAVRYYRNALYAPAAASDVLMRRATRLELIRLLLAHDDRSRALAELLAAANDSPNDAPSASELGDLFMQAGDDSRALEQFTIALRLTPANHDVRRGAGIAAFHLGRYPEARRHLLAAGVLDSDARRLLETATYIVANNPVAPRLALPERRRRMLAALNAARSHLAMCAGTTDAASMQRNVDVAIADLEKRRPATADAFDGYLDVVALAEAAAADCGTASPADLALALIVRTDSSQ
jgi:tetratricopeptide (TPR) repeat protein